MLVMVIAFSKNEFYKLVLFSFDQSHVWRKVSANKREVEIIFSDKRRISESAQSGFTGSDQDQTGCDLDWTS